MSKPSQIKHSHDGNYGYEGYPNMILHRKEGTETFRKMRQMLEDGNAMLRKMNETPTQVGVNVEDGVEAEIDVEVEHDEEDRMRIEYRLQILAVLACCAVSPKVDLKAIKSNILKREHSDVVAFNKAVNDILSELGLG